MDSDAVRRQWADRSGEFSPTYYAHRGPDETSELLLSVLDRRVDRDASILELGCSSGRHLSHLQRNGYTNLAGIDINEAAFDVMAEAYPALATTGTFYPGAIEDVVTRFDDGAFDVLFSVEALQHLHPDAEWVFEELYRITDDLLITVENEGWTIDQQGDTAVPEESRAAGDGSGADHQENVGCTTDPSVNYVDTAVPLYYRDWHDVLTGTGFEQVVAGTVDRDTVRVFRLPRE